MPIIRSDGIIKLDLADNKIRTIGVGSFMPKLDVLNLGDNKLTNFGIAQLAFEGMSAIR